MKSIKIAVFFLTALFLVSASLCGRGLDYSYEASECLDTPAAPESNPSGTCEVTASAGTINLYHKEVWYNCCAEIKVDATLEKKIIQVIENEDYTKSGGPCRCVCAYDLKVSINKLDPGEYVLEVWNGDMSVQHCSQTVQL